MPKKSSMMQLKRNQSPKLGDILLVKGKWYNPISKLIELLTKGKYSHSAVFLEENLIIESGWHGVVVSSSKKYLGRSDILRLRFKSFQREEFSLFLIKQLGKKYDFLGLIGILRSILFNIDTNPFNNKNRFWCSELIADGLIVAEYPVDFGKKTHLVSPNDLYRALI